MTCLRSLPSAHRAVFALVGLFALAGCFRDETISGYADRDAAYALIGPQDAPIAATIAFPRRGRVEVTAPCSTYRARQSAPYPWFEMSAFETLETTCTAREAEAALIAAIATMTLAEVAGRDLILSNDAGGELLFQAPDA